MNSSLVALERLAALKESGVLTNVEFEIEKALLLEIDKAPNEKRSNSLLKWLFDWGVLVVLVLAGAFWFGTRDVATHVANGRRPPQIASPSQAAAQSQMSEILQPSAEFRQLCVYAEMVPTGFRLNTLIDVMTAQGRPLVWKIVDGNWVMQSKWQDEVTNADHSFVAEFVKPEGIAASEECGGYPGDLLVTRLIFDDHEASRFAIGTSMQAAFGQIFGKDGAGAPQNQPLSSSKTNAAVEPSKSQSEFDGKSDEDLKALNLTLNEECRGGSHDTADKVCRQRDASGLELERRGICWAYSDANVYPMDYDWHPCSQSKPD